MNSGIVNSLTVNADSSFHLHISSA